MIKARHLASALTCFALTACGVSTPPTCAANNVDCFMAQLSFRDSAGAAVHIDFVDTATILALEAATSSSPSVPFLTSGPPSLTFPYGTLIDGAAVIFTDSLDLTFTDPNGCQPVVALTLTSNGAHSKHTGCFPGLHDMKKAGTILSNIGFTATAAADTTFGVELAPISSTDCASIDAPATLVTMASAVANLPVSIPLMISPPSTGSGGGGGSGGSGGSGGGGGSCSATFQQCCPLGAGHGNCCVPSSCGCPSPATSTGICTSGGCLNACSSGQRICAC